MGSNWHRATEQLLADHHADLVAAWVAALTAPGGELPRAPAPALRDLAQRALGVFAGDGQYPLVEWLSEGHAGALRDEQLVLAVQRLTAAVRALVAPRGEPAWSAHVAETGEALVRAVVAARTARQTGEADESAASFRELALVLRDTLFSLLANGTVRYVSPAIEALTGHAPADFLADPNLWAMLVVPEDMPAFQRLIRRVTVDQQLAEEVYRVRNVVTGELKVVLTRANPLVIDGLVVRVDGLLVDITERRELEQRLERTEHLRSLGQLAGGIAHDFNNLLVSILGYSDLLLVRARPGGKDAQALELIAAAAEQGAALTERLLTFARGAASSAKQPVRLDKVLRDTLALVAPSVPHAIRLRLVEHEAVPVVVANAPQVGEAILNLVLNAVQACSGGLGDDVQLTLRPATREEAAAIGADAGCTVAVSDNGPGMDDATTQRVFEPLFTTRGDCGGTGLGCSMAYSVAVDHGGLILVDASPGAGSVFRFVLPAAPPGTVPIRSASRKLMPTPVERIRGARHILVADDEPSVRQLLVDVLDGAGFRVTSVASGKEAVEAVARAPRAFDLAILDVMMQPVDGTEAFTQLRRLAPDLPIVFCSAYSDSSRISLPEVLTEAPIIHKPFRPIDLVESVRQHLDRWDRARRANLSRP